MDCDLGSSPHSPLGAGRTSLWSPGRQSSSAKGKAKGQHQGRGHVRVPGLGPDSEDEALTVAQPTSRQTQDLADCSVQETESETSQAMLHDTDKCERQNVAGDGAEAQVSSPTGVHQTLANKLQQNCVAWAHILCENVCDICLCCQLLSQIAFTGAYSTQYMQHPCLGCSCSSTVVAWKRLAHCGF